MISCTNSCECPAIIWNIRSCRLCDFHSGSKCMLCTHAVNVDPGGILSLQSGQMSVNLTTLKNALPVSSFNAMISFIKFTPPTTVLIPIMTVYSTPVRGTMTSKKTPRSNRAISSRMMNGAPVPFKP